jgi:hypothetical protein
LLWWSTACDVARCSRAGRSGGVCDMTVSRRLDCG